MPLTGALESFPKLTRSLFNLGGKGRAAHHPTGVKPHETFAHIG